MNWFGCMVENGVPSASAQTNEPVCAAVDMPRAMELCALLVVSAPLPMAIE